jgi:hypothetical protein
MWSMNQSDLKDLFLESLRRQEDIIAMREVYHLKDEALAYNYQEFEMKLQLSYFNPKSFGQELLIEPYKIKLEQK